MSIGRGSRFPNLVALVALSALAALLAAGTRPANAAANDESAVAVPHDRVEGVSALGRIEPEHGVVQVAAPSTPQAILGSIVSRLLVKAGDDVTAGQVLAETDTTAVEQAGVMVAKAELELAERESEVAVGEEQEACSRADVAERTSKRRAKLLRSGVTSDEEADVAAGDARALSGSCAAARIATKAAASKVNVARARQQLAETELERTYVRAPVDGRVLRIVRRPGELVDLDGVVKLGHISRMYAIAEVYETDVRRVRIGQKATVTSRALAGPLSGVVEFVRLEVRKQDATGTDPAARKDARIVEVEVLLDDPKPVAGLTNLQVEVVFHP